MLVTIMAKSNPANPQDQVLSVARVHFFIAGIYALYIIVSDAWNLITPEATFHRWTMLSIFLVVTTLLWYFARSKIIARPAIWGFVLLDIAMATFNIYTQRGMASRAVVLFAIPIIVSSLLASRPAIFATASLSLAAYTMATVRYFYAHFGEGYKVELYGEVSFYCAVFFVIAALVWIVTRQRK